MPTFPIQRHLRSAVIAAAATFGAVACKDFTSIDASFANVTNADVVYAINGSPPGSPNSVKFFDGLVSRADQGFGYDIAFDLDEGGNVMLIPAKALATTFSNPYSVGLQRVPGTFESVQSAPKDGYRFDTTMVVQAGQTVVIESRDNVGICLYSLKGNSYFTKLVVTEVDQARRRINFTRTVNRNCGFRSFLPGIPRD